MHPKNISIADYRYELPQEKIAHHPLSERDASKLLIYRDGRVSEDSYRNIAASVPEDSLLVFNNTKVVEARILFTKASGGKIEVFCLEPPPGHGGVGQAMMQTGKVRWKCLIGGASKWKPGQVLTKSIGAEPIASTGSTLIASTASQHPLTLEARYIDKSEGAFLIEFSWNDAALSFAEVLHRAGLIPLPPYIRRSPDASDSQRYQTVYAQHDGSVAAPTAGLHFTDTIFEALAAKNIKREFVTLHVGAGTFLPVKAETMEGHNMHVEYISVTRRSIENILLMLRDREKRRDARPGNAASQPLIIPVGTTSARTLESLYWLGFKTVLDPSIGPERLIVSQWDAYDLPSRTGAAASKFGDFSSDPAEHSSDYKALSSESSVPSTEYAGAKSGSESGGSSSGPGAAEALQSLLQWLDRSGHSELITHTQLLITPGYRWRIADALVTNFHQPESTLLLLVASLIGPDWKKVYDYALAHEFRFLSYGDGSLLFPPDR